MSITNIPSVLPPFYIIALLYSVCAHMTAYIYLQYSTNIFHTCMSAILHLRERHVAKHVCFCDIEWLGLLKK